MYLYSEHIAYSDVCTGVHHIFSFTVLHIVNAFSSGLALHLYLHVLQVASRPVGPWGSPIHQPFPIHQPMVVQPQSDQPTYTTVVPYPQDIRASHLADQMDGSLHISGLAVAA